MGILRKESAQGSEYGFGAVTLVYMFKMLQKHSGGSVLSPYLAESVELQLWRERHRGGAGCIGLQGQQLFKNEAAMIAFKFPARNRLLSVKQ